MVIQSRESLQKAREYLLPAAARTDHSYQTRILQSYEFSFDVDSQSSQFDAPVLIVTGKQDTVVGYRTAWQMTDQYPRATFAVLDRAGHLLGLEQDDLFRALASEWLRRVAESATEPYRSDA
jgi:pimeloyl-ACP methyl ester carboxylesterase